MSLFVLDTDILTLFEREHAIVVARVAAVPGLPVEDWSKCRLYNSEGTMAEKKKAKRVLLGPIRPDSFTRSDLLKAIKKVAAARRRRQQPPVPDGSK
jgi:hypothetical protein